MLSKVWLFLKTYGLFPAIGLLGIAIALITQELQPLILGIGILVVTLVFTLDDLALRKKAEKEMESDILEL